MATPTAPAVEVLAGNRVLEGMAPYAARYGGHQFGVWAGQLGDGRAITLAEIAAPDGRRHDVQLKGAGRTPYSRTADGRAVLRSSVREFICSEAMHWLGVPTTRALALVATGESVIRDMFYDGNPEPEPGAIVCRVAPTFVRFGNFEILAAHDEIDTLRRLADYVIVRHFPELGTPSAEVYARWFREVCRRTAVMVAEWTRVGFVHGVMNTDNMSVLGLTIDYGPYGWLEGFDPMWTPNTTDAQGRRYRFGAQPQIDPEHDAVIGGLRDRARDVQGEAAVVLVQRQRPGLTVVSRVEVDEVNVGGEVELLPSELAHAQHHVGGGARGGGRLAEAAGVTRLRTIDTASARHCGSERGERRHRRCQQRGSPHQFRICACPIVERSVPYQIELLGACQTMWRTVFRSSPPSRSCCTMNRSLRVSKPTSTFGATPLSTYYTRS